MIHRRFDPRLTGAVSTAKERSLCLDTVTDDLAAAMVADGGELLNCALKAVEDMVHAGGNDVKRQIVVVAAHFTFGHGLLLETVAGHRFRSTRLRPAPRIRQAPPSLSAS